MATRRQLRDEDLDAVIGAVLRATQAFVGLALRSLTAAGTSITLPQYRMLVTLDAKGDQNVRDLAARLGVDRLHRHPHVQPTGQCRADRPERRPVRPAGGGHLAHRTGPGRGGKRVTRARRENVARLLRSLPPPRREQLVDLLDEFAELAERDPV